MPSPSEIPFFGQGPIAGFAAGLCVSAIFVIPIIRVLAKIKAEQVVSKHLELHQIKAGTPTMGGWIFVIPFVLIFAKLQPGYSVSILLFALLGWMDDYVIPKAKPGSRGLEWKTKILLQFTFAFLTCILVGHFGGDAGRNFGRIAWDIFFVLLFANAYNFTDGVDGLAFSVGMNLFAGIAVLALLLGSPVLVIPIAVMAGAMLPFGYLNAPKAKIFMGDTGSMAVGALIGIMIAELAWNNSSSPVVLIAFTVLSLVMFAELIPPPMQIFWVKRFKKRLFPMTPIHHAFEKVGWKEIQIDALFAGVQLACSVIAVLIVWRFH